LKVFFFCSLFQALGQRRRSRRRAGDIPLVARPLFRSSRPLTESQLEQGIDFSKTDLFVGVTQLLNVAILFVQPIYVRRFCKVLLFLASVVSLQFSSWVIFLSLLAEPLRMSIDGKLTEKEW